MPDPICSICNDGLCENHERDCWGDNLFSIFGAKCACPNRKDN